MYSFKFQVVAPLWLVIGFWDPFWGVSAVQFCASVNIPVSRVHISSLASLLLHFEYVVVGLIPKSHYCTLETEMSSLCFTCSGCFNANELCHGSSSPRLLFQKQLMPFPCVVPTGTPCSLYTGQRQKCF